MKKGDHLGNFVFGGSSIAMIFEKKANLTFKEDLYVEGKDGSKKARTVELNSFLAFVSSPSNENTVIN